MKRASRHVVDGYDRVIEWMAAPLADRVRLGAIVTRVKWARGNAVVEVQYARRAATGSRSRHARSLSRCRSASCRRPAATSARSRSSPISGGSSAQRSTASSSGYGRQGRAAPPRARLGVGGIRPEGAGGGDRCAQLLHSNDPDFPVWWTAYPLRAPVIVAWRGGPGARRLSQLPPDEIESRAIAVARASSQDDARGGCGRWSKASGRTTGSSIPSRGVPTATTRRRRQCDRRPGPPVEAHAVLCRRGNRDRWKHRNRGRRHRHRPPRSKTAHACLVIIHAPWKTHTTRSSSAPAAPDRPRRCCWRAKDTRCWSSTAQHFRATPFPRISCIPLARRR